MKPPISINSSIILSFPLHVTPGHHAVWEPCEVWKKLLDILCLLHNNCAWEKNVLSGHTLQHGMLAAQLGSSSTKRWQTHALTLALTNLHLVWRYLIGVQDVGWLGPSQNGTAGMQLPSHCHTQVRLPVRYKNSRTRVLIAHLKWKFCCSIWWSRLSR